MGDRELIAVERRDQAAIVTLDDERKRNALTTDLAVQLIDAFEELQRAPEVRAIVLTGAGSAFSAGGDVHRMASGGSARTPTELVDEMADSSYTTLARRTIKTVVRTEKPVIVAVNGPAFGWGMDIALAGDVRIAGRRAKMGEVFVRLGAVSGTGAIYLLPRIIGLGRAAELLLTGRTIDAQEAKELGVVSSVWDDEDLLPEALRIAGEVAKAAPLAVQLTKRALYGTANLSGSLDDALHEAMYFNQICLNSEDHKEAARAIIDKDAPKFQRQ